MAPEGELRRQPEEALIRKQEKSMSLNEVAKGYESQVKEIYGTAAAPAIRNEVKKFANAITTKEGPEQLEEAQKLLGALEAYKSVFIGTSDDPRERAALAVALAIREKKFQ